MVDAKELLKAMGFEHEQHTDYYEFGPDDRRISTCHIITHPQVPGLLLSAATIERAMMGAVSCIRILTLMNEGGKSADDLREMGLLQKNTDG